MSADHHDHDHDHDDHAAIEEGGPPTEFELLERAIRELLIEKEVFSADDLRRQVDRTDSVSPADGAKVVARAWTDPAFKAQLLADPKAAIESLGYDVGPAPNLVVLENTSTLHHVVVCTLCSCYPRVLLGPPPDWYKSKEYRGRVVIDPRGVLHEFGTELSDQVEIKVVDSTADMRYLVLPPRPAGSENLSEQALAALVTRDCMVGVTFPDRPAQ
ncbi:MAG: nitrile hydratase subunit alpha [Alphaproteobacteria bacterium]|nr:nitrile hydratase subunit alpha [Alphaproteobacteria bacterium]